jgi:hypothetical protein
MTAKYPALCPKPASSSKHFRMWHDMLGEAHASVAAFFEDFRRLGDAALTEPTDEKDDALTFWRGQEILRTMIVVASAGLEAALKGALRHTLDALASSDERGKDRFEKWVMGELFDDERRVREPAYFASVLASPSPRDSLAWAYVRSRVSASLQSQEKLAEVVRDFAFEEASAKAVQTRVRQKKVAEAFACRNEIVHEYDFIYEPHLTRRARSALEIVSHVNTLFDVGTEILSAAVAHVEKMQRGTLPPPKPKAPRKR